MVHPILRVPSISAVGNYTGALSSADQTTQRINSTK
jgi:hypothetical protein